jgi:hypothetical protein
MIVSYVRRDTICVPLTESARIFVFQRPRAAFIGYKDRSGASDTA